MKKNNNNKERLKSSILLEIFGAIVAFFFGNLTSKIGIVLFTLFFGILVLIRPIIDENGIEQKKTIIPYLIGSSLIIFSTGMMISWLRKRNAKDNCQDQAISSGNDKFARK